MTRLFALLLSFPVLVSGTAKAYAEEADHPEILVTATPLSGEGAQVADGETLKSSRAVSIADQLARTAPGVSINEMQGNPLQTDINFRGFTASPVLGTPQGLSVYLDGVRINQPFGEVVNWDLIPTSAIARIDLVSGSAPQFGRNSLGGALVVGQRSRGTPRIANRLLRRLRDFAVVAGASTLDETLAGEALARLDVDPHGLDQMDRKILQTIIGHYEGGPVGVKTLAVALSEEVRTIEEIYEPYLIQCGLIKRTPRGRVATAKAYAHIKKGLCD